MRIEADYEVRDTYLLKPIVMNIRPVKDLSLLQFDLPQNEYGFWKKVFIATVFVFMQCAKNWLRFSWTSLVCSAKFVFSLSKMFLPIWAASMSFWGF